MILQSILNFLIDNGWVCGDIIDDPYGHFFRIEVGDYAIKVIVKDEILVISDRFSSDYCKLDIRNPQLFDKIISNLMHQRSMINFEKQLMLVLDGRHPDELTESEVNCLIAKIRTVTTLP